AGNTASDASNADFTIADQSAPLVHVVAPNGGEVWDEGSDQVVRWTAGDNLGVDSVNVDYSLNGPGGPWLALQHGVTAADSVVWTLPQGASDSALVRVTAFDHALNQASDGSDALFQVHGTAAAG